jgi:hypothetical protein
VNVVAEARVLGEEQKHNDENVALEGLQIRSVVELLQQGYQLTILTETTHGSHNRGGRNSTNKRLSATAATKTTAAEQNINTHSSTTTPVHEIVSVQRCVCVGRGGVLIVHEIVSMKKCVGGGVCARNHRG